MILPQAGRAAPVVSLHMEDNTTEQFVRLFLELVWLHGDGLISASVCVCVTTPNKLLFI